MIMKYISAEQAASKWGISTRRVQKLLLDGRVEGASRVGRDYMIPSGAKKPGDPRKKADASDCGKKSPQKKSLSDDLEHMIETTVVPLPQNNPDAIIHTVDRERFRIQFESELAYMRGDFERIIQCYHKTKNDTAARLRICAVTIAAAISTGNYPLYKEIEKFLQDVIKTNDNSRVSAFIQLCFSTAYTGAGASNMVADWLKNGDFSLLYPCARQDATYKRAKYFQYLDKSEAMLITARDALNFYELKHGFISFYNIYFQVAYALACCRLGRMEEAKDYLLKVMHIALPYGFITPFAESQLAFNGLLEKCLENEFPEYYSTITKQWKQTFFNWIEFHNYFTKDNLTKVLSLREYEVATLATQRIPYTKVAEQLNLSVSSIKSIMQIIYEKTFTNNREELSKLVF